MKRKGNLYEKIISIKNLYLAEKSAGKKKSKNKEIIEFRKNLDENILKLYISLNNDTYSISEYSHFIVREPKERKISKLDYKDRIVHHAILLYTEDIFVNNFISQTYSCIKKRGIHNCLNKLTEYLRNNNLQYCLKLDIRKFYPSINNKILKFLLRRKFKDKRLLKLFDKIIDSHKGVPLGNYTSQFFGNFYISQFDHWIKEQLKEKFYLRYCDDIVILENSKEHLHELRRKIQQYLLINLKLELSSYQVFEVNKQGIDFLGYKSYLRHILLRKSIKKRFIKMIKFKRNNKSIASYNGWLKHANCRNLEKKYLNKYEKSSV